VLRVYQILFLSCASASAYWPAVTKAIERSTYERRTRVVVPPFELQLRIKSRTGLTDRISTVPQLAGQDETEFAVPRRGANKIFYLS